ncbi:MAG: hypothetical protein P8K77_05865 [Polaribacter sp.]|nr:hypothetical protein [Polaribacter sp.]
MKNKPETFKYWRSKLYQYHLPKIKTTKTDIFLVNQDGDTIDFILEDDYETIRSVEKALLREFNNEKIDNYFLNTEPEKQLGHSHLYEDDRGKVEILSRSPYRFYIRRMVWTFRGESRVAVLHKIKERAKLIEDYSLCKRIDEVIKILS